MEEFESIFTESSEDMGLMFKSYEPILGITNKFLDKVSQCINDLIHKPTDVDIDLSKEISEFKSDVTKKFVPTSIVISKTSRYIKEVKSFQKECDSTLAKFAKLKDSISFGGNYYRAIINKPKVYSKDIDEEKYAKINSNIRNVNRAMDWIEKILIDLFNMADQDLNILTIVDKVYAKHHIYESTEMPVGVITEDDADIVGFLPEANMWVVNTRNKKTGTAPDYLKNNHDMAKWGEEDNKDKKPESDDEDKTLDDYKRPSAEEPVSKPTEPEVDPYTGDDEEEKSPEEKRAERQAIQNYYYYTYNNSLNKNSHSFNRKDDHSTKDDHSINNSYNKTDDKNDEENLKNVYHSLESTNPWNLNLDSLEH